MYNVIKRDFYVYCVFNGTKAKSMLALREKNCILYKRVCKKKKKKMIHSVILYVGCIVFSLFFV